MKKIYVLLLSIFTILTATAQVTTSSMNGKVTDEKGGAVVGATVEAVHTPSGTTYYAATDASGSYRIHNMRVGGPYKVVISYIGDTDNVIENIYLKLGEAFVCNAVMAEKGVAVEAVVISATVNPLLNSQKQGTSTNVNSRVLQTLPTGSRTINDMVALTPQANGMSFGGRDSRMNNFTVDGAGFNNNFGLSSDLPGGDNGPISLDAIEEISVNLAPYDVRQSRFTGAAINAVTKGGTNAIDGSFYTYQRFKNTGGKTVNGNEVKNAGETSSQTYGFSIGGPIIKNKLFFFVNAEYSPETAAGPSWVPSTDGVASTEKGISRTTEADLEKVHQYLLTKYGYEAGKYKDWDAFENYNYKIMARIDWNINKNNKLMLRYNDVKTSAMNLTNGNSCPSGLTRVKKNRMSEYSIAFSNNFYRMDNTVRSFAAELNSKINEKISNQLNFTYNKIRDGRTSPSSLFPHVDIYKATDASGNDVDVTSGTFNEDTYYTTYQGTPYMSFGYELFTYNNEVINNTWNITDNVTINLDNHTVVAGASYEHLYVRNSYIREGTSYYRYASVDDFLNDAKPIGFGLTYGYNGVDAPGQMLTFGQASAYVQDEWNVNDNLTVTGGIRFELPLYLDKNMVTNTKIQQLTSTYPEGAWDTGTWPKSRISVNPRIGFNWDVNGDRSFQVRGGTGIFSGMMPFVWFTNQVGGASFVQCPELSWNYQDCINKGIDKFYPNYKDLLANTTTFPNQADPTYLVNKAAICLVDKNFKFPQVWRTNLAFDVKLPWDMVFTGEALITKDINAVRQINSNQADPTGEMKGADNRSVWNAGAPTKIQSTIGTAMLFTNTNKGYSAQLTAQLTKNFANGFSAMAAYTYSLVKDVTSNPGSAAASAWASSSSVNSLNEDVLSYSNFSIPHRLIADVSYRFRYGKNFATTVSLLYQGSHNGRISYVYSGDVNGDGQTGDLMYIPKDASEISFVDYKDMTAAAQSDAFFEYINNNKYLKSRKGNYAERFGGLQNWVSTFDVKILQDIFTNFGTSNRYTLQLSLDILNVGNMINDKWGCYYTNSWLNYQDVSPLAVSSQGSTTAAPTFRLNANTIEEFQTKSEWTRALSTGNCWSMLFGLRLIF